MDPRVLCGNRWLGLDISGGLSCPLCIDLAFGGGGGGEYFAKPSVGHIR